MRSIGSRVVVFVALAGCALSGCGSVEHGTGVPVDTAPREIAQAVCPKAYTCCMASQLSGNSMAGTDEPSCETATEQGFHNQLATVQASQDAGRVVYDGDKLDACLQTIRSADCATLNMTNHLMGVPGCESFVRPLVAVGGACGNDFECIDSYCRHTPNTSGDGTCEPFAIAGQACSDEIHCGADLICDGNSNTCVALGPVTPPANACFYASGCDVGGDLRGCNPLALLVVLIALAARWRRT